MKITKSPLDLEWIEGDPPDVNTVDYNSAILVWFNHNRAVSFSPWKDELNPLQWYNGNRCTIWCNGLSIGAYGTPKYWAWLAK